MEAFLTQRFPGYYHLKLLLLLWLQSKRYSRPPFVMCVENLWSRSVISQGWVGEACLRSHSLLGADQCPGCRADTSGLRYPKALTSS